MSWRDAIGVLKDVLPQDMKPEEIVWCNRSGWSYDDYRAMRRLGVDPRDYESPIAAFEEVLLSDEVVEAVTVSLLNDDGTGGHLDVTKRALQAALAAAKGTEGSE